MKKKLLSALFVLAIMLTIGFTASADTICSYNVDIASGENQTLVLGDKEAGTFDISGSACKGYTLKDQNSKYLYLSGDSVVRSNNSYTWTYDGGLYAKVKTKVTKKILFWKKTVTKTTKYYLCFDGDQFLLSNDKVTVKVKKTDAEHTYTYLHNKDGKHEAVCTKCDKHEEPQAHDYTYNKENHKCICGKIDPDYCFVKDVKVTEKKTTKTTGFWFFKKTVTKYQYTMEPKTQDVMVSKVEYSGNQEDWDTGDVLLSDIKLTLFYIRVTDENDKVTNWKYENGEVTSLDEDEDEDADAEEDTTGSWFDSDAVGDYPQDIVTSIEFTKTAPALGTYDYTWDAPANGVAYFDKDSGKLTYALAKGNKFVISDENPFCIEPNIPYDVIMSLANDNEVLISTLYTIGLVDSETYKFDNADDMLEISEKCKSAFIAAEPYIVENHGTTVSDEAAFLNALNENLGSSFDQYDDDILDIYFTVEAFADLQGFARMVLDENDQYYNFEKVESMTGLNLLNVSKVKDFSKMFKNSSVKSLDLSGWNVSSAVTMKEMFKECKNLTSLNVTGKGWDTSNVTDMSDMFFKCMELETLDLTSLDTEKVEDMSQMFSVCEKLKSLNLNFDTSNLKDAESMFNGVTAIETLDLSSFDTSKVTTMARMFASCVKLKDLNISSFNSSSLNNANSMFDLCKALEEINFADDFTLENAEEMYALFKNCKNLKSLDLSNFDIRKAQKIDSMFMGCSKLESITFGNKFTVENAANLANMFGGCATIEALDLSTFDTTNVITLMSMFSDCASLKTITFGSNFSTSNVTDMSNMFFGCKALKSIDLSCFNTAKTNRVDEMFAGCEALETVTFGNNFAVENAENMGSLFSGCKALKSIDLSCFNTAKANRVDEMFAGCEALETVTFGNNFTVQNVENMENMFSGCNALKSLDFTNFNTAKATTFKGMLKDCEALETVTFGNNFTTSNVTDMSSMFSGCKALKSIDLTNFNTAKTSTLESMFTECEALETVTFGSNFTASDVTNMSQMFQDCISITSIDLSNFNTANVVKMAEMFYMTNENDVLYHIYIGPGWSTEKVDSSNNMFKNCKKLPWYSDGMVDEQKAYAGGDNLGYLEYKEN